MCADISPSNVFDLPGDDLQVQHFTLPCSKRPQRQDVSDERCGGFVFFFFFFFF
jgi:hypothetical protein